jgi:DNA invertase Pin-like site-specific DNA recombinase
MDLQLEGLKNAGCARIFTDKRGAQAERPAVKDALAHLRASDTLVVRKLDRLGRGR